MKLGSVCYIPPPSHGHPALFLENLNQFRHKYPVLLCSDHTWKVGSIPISSCPSPECVRMSKVPAAIPNYAFLSSARLAQAEGLDYFFVLQDDCRVGEDDWDDRIFTEFFEKNKNGLNGGTIMSWYPEWTPRFRAMWGKHLSIQRRSGHPGVIVMGEPENKYPGRARRSYANGALSIIRTELIQPIFSRDDLYRRGSAWDDEIGLYLTAQYGDEIYDVLVPMASVMSDCYDHGSTLDQRKQWLLEHKAAAIHQVGERWIPNLK